MPTVLISGDVSVFGVDLAGGTSYTDYLGFIRNVDAKLDVDTVEADPINRAYSQAQPVKKMASISAPLMSVKSGSIKVSSLDLSAFSILGQTFDSYFESGSMTVDIDLKDSSARSDIWKYHQPTGKKKITFDATIKVPATAAAGSQAIQALAYSTTITDVSGTFTWTINSVATTFAATIKSLEIPFAGGDFQVLKISGESNAPDSGTFPAAPTGTTTIFEKALNTFTATGISLTNHATEGVNLAGLFHIAKANVSVQESGLVLATYEFMNKGAVTPTSN